MASGPRRSMRRELLLILLGCVAAIWIATAVVSYFDARHEIDELAARLRALIRRSRGEPAPVLSIGALRLDPASRTVAYRNQPVALQTREFDLLQELMLNAGRVLSRRQLEERLYAWGQEVESNAVEVHVHHLRRKLAPALIRTVRGVGYVMPRERNDG